MTIISPAPGPGTGDSASKINCCNKAVAPQKHKTTIKSGLKIVTFPGPWLHMIASDNCNAFWNVRWTIQVGGRICANGGQVLR